MPIRAEDTHCCSCCTKDARRAPDQAVGSAATEDVLPRRSPSRSCAPSRDRAGPRLPQSSPSASACCAGGQGDERLDHGVRGRHGLACKVPIDGASPRSARYRHRLRGICLLSGGARAAERGAVCRVVCTAAARPGPLPSCRGGRVRSPHPQPPSDSQSRRACTAAWSRLASAAHTGRLASFAGVLSAKRRVPCLLAFLDAAMSKKTMASVTQPPAVHPSVCVCVCMCVCACFCVWLHVRAWTSVYVRGSVCACVWCVRVHAAVR